jgi:hypothetical protein
MMNNTKNSNEPTNEVRNEKIRVCVRVRPQLKNELGKENVCHVGKNVRFFVDAQSFFKGKQIRVQDMTHTVEGTYDMVLGRTAKQ